MTPFPDPAIELLQRAAAARGAEYDALVTQAVAEYEAQLGSSQGSGFTGSSALGELAEKRSPREAMWLRRKGLEWIERFPAGEMLQATESRQAADAYAHLARYRTGAEADALFGQAEKALARMASGRLGVYLVEQWAELLCDWADQERNASADALFERARGRFAEAYRLDPDDLRLYRYCRALRRRANAAADDRAMELLATARDAIEELLARYPKDFRLWQFLGQTTILEAQKSPGSEPAWGEAERCFRQAIRARPAAEGDILTNSAAALGLFAMARSGAEALALYAQADAKSREAEAVKPDSRVLRKNWSAFLLREARERGGPPELWERARQQGLKAEAIDPGSGAYNLACIAADLADYDGVGRWLTQAAECAQMPTLSHTLRDVNFASLLSERWFRELLDSIYGAGLAKGRGR